MNSLLSKEGQDWVTLALDPFHDYVRMIEGMPDENTMHSFVREHIQTSTYTSAGNGGSLNIAFTGFHGPWAAPVESMSAFFNGEAGGPAQTVDIYPISVISADGSHSANFENVLVGDAVCSGFPTTPTYDVPSRLIGIGIEVHDITQNLYQQGTLGCARITGAMDQVDNYCVYPHNFPVTQEGVYQWLNYGPTCSREPCLAGSRAKLSMIPGFVEWECKRGAYVVPKFCRAQQPAVFQVGEVESFPDNNHFHPFEVRESQTEGTQIRLIPAYVDSTNHPEKFNAIKTWVQSGFAPVQVWLEGLNAASQIKVTVRTFVEYFPEVSNATALATATASPAYDPAAFAVYHAAAITLPHGVPAGMNAAGDYWKMVKNVLGKALGVGSAIVPGILSLAGHPELGLIAGAGLKALTGRREKGGNSTMVRPVQKPANGNRKKKKNNNKKN